MHGSRYHFCLLSWRLKIARKYFTESRVRKVHMFYFPNLYVLNNLMRGKKETGMSEEGKRGSEEEERKGGRGIKKI